jgi:hypothetical protein
MVSTYLEDAIWRWHLQDQVPIVDDRHKLVQGWRVQNGVEGEVDLHDIKEDALRVEVLRHPKCDREGDTTARHN